MFERLALLNIGRCTAMKSECTISLSSDMMFCRIEVTQHYMFLFQKLASLGTAMKSECTIRLSSDMFCRIDVTQHYVFVSKISIA